MVQIGKIYKHFKGNKYKVLHIAKDSETTEDMVVYRSEYGNKQIWIRSLKMFEEELPIEKQKQYKQKYRFQLDI